MTSTSCLSGDLLAGPALATQPFDLLDNRLRRRPEFKHHWQHTAKMILDQVDVADVSRRVELALLYDGKLDLVAPGQRKLWELDVACDSPGSAGFS